MSRHGFNFRGKKLEVVLEKYSDLKKTCIASRDELNKEIYELLLNCWGSFPADFIEKHIFGADKMIVARVESKCIGLCAMSLRDVLGFRIHYIEFLLINKEFQKCGLGSFLSFKMISQEIVSNLFSILIGKPLEIFFITPNIRMLTSAARFASFIYPNPYLVDEKGIIPPADEKTWNIAMTLLKNSDNPDRKLEKEGLVLIGSYTSTPWLIYNNDTAPWHTDEKINNFTRNYLGYHNGQDREFMVRAHINLYSIVRYLLHI